MPRIFIGIDIPADVKKKIAPITKQSEEELRGVRWISERNMHITLKFLGNCPEETAEEIIGLLEGVAKRTGPFSFKLQKLGGFPSNRKASVIWVGVKEGADRLCRLQSLVDDELEGFGFKKEKRQFHPHVTIGRSKTPLDIRAFVDRIDTADLNSRSVDVTDLVLFRSDLKLTGAEYTPLVRITLRGTDE